MKTHCLVIHEDGHTCIYGECRKPGCWPLEPKQHTNWAWDRYGQPEAKRPRRYTEL
jgi:hypothetical protein